MKTEKVPMSTMLRHYGREAVHKFWVVWYTAKACKALMIRALKHDVSKLRSPEAQLFAMYGSELKHLTYGSQEYFDQLARLGEALKHHYASNSHHPEYYGGKLCNMQVLDLVEMMVDWRAAVRRHADGNILRSIEHNLIRFRCNHSKEALILDAEEMGFLSDRQMRKMVDELHRRLDTEGAVHG